MKKLSGQSLIGILVALAIFSILAQAVLTIAATSYRFVSYNRARITARHLAQEKIEFIRNLPYDNIGTVGGAPNGTLPQSEDVLRNGLKFTVSLSIVYVDDPFDGIQGSVPADTLETDYKRIRVSISWEGLESSNENPIVLLTDVSPKGIETTEGGGTLSIIVFDANGNPVPGASLHIVQNTVVPNIDVTFQTAINGRFIYTGVPACVSCYQITVSKSGQSTERTYSTTEVANPTKPHQTIIQGQLTEISFLIDHTSTIDLRTTNGRDDGFSNLGNLSFRLRGEKTIGTDSSAQPVYKYDEILTTESNGFLTLNDVEWDSYYFTPNPSSSYDVSGTQPIQPVVVQPEDSVAFAISLVSKSTNSLLLSFVDQQDNPIATVSATLSKGAYSSSNTSGVITDPDYGQIFFEGLDADLYSLTATHSAYLDFSGSVPVIGEDTEKVILTPK
ncbi:MAG: hypothetical protein US62_C0007G0011 [Candidatus Woesebacteria bacterium GW2011_GWA1_37_8]|uniref:Uncharacterized protein n=2 Tax=Candidatus Woeseibacteriota TaxID=1752722 RepID=A0A0G0L5H1_9BACT|nr:MAG: hypothetical protein US39_C0001G0093 [Microgenomates group bacterium GW2011_GWC1_37_12b]KKQ45936.1 MAG: hypothetical protein US62_C0007G0011 [Candidatus Woesebacteria bacterium GW2011_GWA1_37_8]KKQ87248.1 MAG: hypothetical protein UT10_C0008G0009 [Candidatus Woesebacteria bacterium GW2011_GWB1_38_8b]